METQSARNAGTYVFTAYGVRIYKNTSISDGNVLCYCIVRIATAPANKKIKNTEDFVQKNAGILFPFAGICAILS